MKNITVLNWWLGILIGFVVLGLLNVLMYFIKTKSLGG